MKPYICPACENASSVDEWNSCTQHFLRGTPPLEEAKQRRDLHKEQEYVCPTCLEGVYLLGIIPAH